MRWSLPWMMCVACLAVLPAGAQEEPEERRKSGIVEQARGRLMQIDVTARGPAELLAGLTADNFSVTVGREDIPEFILDRVCVGDPIEDLELSVTESTHETTPAVSQLRTLLFFDQTHLTHAGRRRSLELARELIPELTAGGRSQTMIVSAGRRFEILAEWTSDETTLLAALDRLEAAPDHLLTWADEEDFRIQRLMSAIDRLVEASNTAQMRREQSARSQQTVTIPLRSGGSRGVAAPGTAPAPTSITLGGPRADEVAEEEAFRERSVMQALIHMRSLARDLTREADGRTAGALSLFAVGLEQLRSYPAPKAVVYFADTMRANPGDFYVDLVDAAESRALQKYAPETGVVQTRPTGGRKGGAVYLSTENYVREFQAVIDLATENGVRMYTVQGRGLTEHLPARSRLSSARVSTANPGAFVARFKDAENSLSGLARETGGRSFLGAADATQIASRILDDLSCLFVMSFRPIELKEDRATNIWINVDRPGVELQYRPKLIALSDKERSKARLANAFWGRAEERSPARVLAIPTGFEKGKYTVLVQFAIPGSDLSGSDWDMGVTAVVGYSKIREASSRVVLNQPGLPLVFEAEIRIKPGDYAISAVARNRETEEILSTRAEGSLPKPDERDPFVAATHLLQRAPGAFARGKETKTVGSLAHGSEHWLRPDRPTGIVALVCGGKSAEPVVVVRRLEGASVVSFDPVEMDFRKDRCSLLVDTVDPGLFTSGRFTYTVDLATGDGIRQASMQEFLVVSPEEIAAARVDNGE